MLHNKENDGWDSCTNGSLPKCLEVADMICADEIQKWASSVQSKEDDIIENSAVDVMEMTNPLEDDLSLDAILNTMGMETFLNKNIKSVKKNVTETIKLLPELEKRVSKISISKGCIYLYKTEKRKKQKEDEAGDTNYEKSSGK